jgi:UDP-perosamine 4-acetyltransferase
MVLDAIEGTTPSMRCAVLDPDRALWGTSVLGAPVLGGDERIADVVAAGARWFVVGLGGVKDNGPRRRLFELALGHGLQPLTVVHPRACCSSHSTVGGGSVVLPGAVINVGVRVGRNVIVNSGAVVEHHCEIGDHAHVATGARLTSTVRVGAGAHIGAGATIRQGVSLGDGCVVGAGAVVLADVAAEVTVVGVPARPMSQRREAD